jgi:hypothetical protein
MTRAEDVSIGTVGTYAAALEGAVHPLYVARCTCHACAVVHGPSSRGQPLWLELARTGPSLTTDAPCGAIESSAFFLLESPASLRRVHYCPRPRAWHRLVRS